MRTVYTGGTFDLFHPGHAHFLWQCRMIAGEDGEVVVALNTDDFVARFKGKPPIMSYEERATCLRACRHVDRVIPNEDGEDSTATILRAKWDGYGHVGPDFIVIGSDWAHKDYYRQMGFTQQWLDDRGIVLIYVPYLAGVSTSDLKRRVVEWAAA